jgi:hypothetical protein
VKLVLSLLAGIVALGMPSLGRAAPASTAAPPARPCHSVMTVYVSVTDEQGRPLAGVRVRAQGASATTSAYGQATLYCVDPRSPGPMVTATLAGYRTAVGQAGNYGVDGPGKAVIVLKEQTLTTIGTASTTSRPGPPLNTEPGAIARITRTQFDDQAAPQVARLFDETPGVVSNHTASSNPASLGVQTSPNLRGSLDYEKSTLIDGHPVATGRFGDYVTTFLSTYVLQDVEIVKGPGAFAPLVVNGIGGSVNFRTRDPSARPTSAFDLVSDGYGGALVHALASSTAGKLGFVVDAVTYGSPGAFTSLPTTVALPSGTQIAGVGTIGSTTSATPPAGTPAGAFPIANAQNNPPNAYVRMTACCQPVDASFLGRSEVLKARWAFSPSTLLTAAYIGNQSRFGLDGAQLQTLAATFAPSGAPVALNPATHLPSNVTEIENEPLFEAELRTTLRNETLIGRWYSASLNRFTGNAVGSPSQPFTGVVNLTGSAPLAGGGTTPAFNGTPATITIPDVFTRTVEEDRVRGGSIAWLHPAGPNEYELTLDRIVSLTNAYSEGASEGVATFAASVPAGSSQTITSVMGRAALHASPRDALTLALYGTTYENRFSTGPAGTGFAFATSTHSEVDPRLGFTHRLPAGDIVVRFAMGGSVTPPAFNVLSGVNQSPASVFRPGATSIMVTQNAGALRPETSFGYDVGVDARFARFTVVSFDAYLTNVRDQLVTTVTPFGTFTPPGATGPIPVFASSAANAGNSRFEGLELSVRRDRFAGVGYVAQGALTRAFAYDVSPALYATATAPFGTNLAVVPGVNYSSTGTGFNGISNKAIPYGQGYAEIHYRTERGALALFGMTYYGNNNAYGVPAFVVANASVRVPVDVLRDRGATQDRAWLQLSIDNVFGVHGQSTIATDAGIPVPLVNGKAGLVNALPFGPRTVRIGMHVGAP